MTWVVHLTGVVPLGVVTLADIKGSQQWRCADCGVRSCCGDPYRACSGPGEPGFRHRWVPMGTGKAAFRHIKST